MFYSDSIICSDFIDKKYHVIIIYNHFKINTFRQHFNLIIYLKWDAHLQLINSIKFLPTMSLSPKGLNNTLSNIIKDCLPIRKFQAEKIYQANEYHPGRASKFKKRIKSRLIFKLLKLKPKISMLIIVKIKSKLIKAKFH
jgi:hypothetical protein